MKNMYKLETLHVCHRRRHASVQCAIRPDLKLISQSGDTVFTIHSQ